MTKYVLASASPRRSELLSQIGLDFCVYPAHGEEVITRQKPSEIVEELSCAKACEVSESFKGSEENDTIIVIGADTIVACDEEIMGKPKDREDAVRMLSRLEGRTHQVYTGVTLVILKSEGTRKVTFHEQTDVTMYPMTMDEISRYVDTREPMDKAGAYAIQGRCAAYIKGINGDYNNVVGLPVARLMHEINNLGLA
jgi:septum formation protein